MAEHKPIGSPPGKLSKHDIVRWLKHLGILIAALVITFLLDTVLPALQERATVNVVVLTCVTSLLQIIRKALTDTRLPEQKDY